jgi:hypothetical protein
LRNMGMFLVLLAQMFGASMNVMTQILEIHSSMHPFQVCTRREEIRGILDLDSVLRDHHPCRIARLKLTLPLPI